MRTLNRIYAWLFGYFWLPCPVCGQMFGGHEIANCFTAALVGKDGRAQRVCPDPQCSHDAAILNMSGGHAQFVRSNVEFSGGAPLYGAASAGTKGYTSGGG